MATDDELNRLLDELCELPPGDRERFFDQRVPDAPTRARLERLLENFDTGTLHVDLPEIDPVGAGASDAPRRIGPYLVKSELGSGGMGVVYLAEQERPRRLVAVKVLRGIAVAQELARRFELEAELLGRLQHPGIAQVIESGTEGAGSAARAYIVMEYVDGQPLTDYANTRDLDLEDRLRLLVEIADAVHHAHLRGVVHRDLKPTNILVTVQGRPKVIDFGVARVMDREDGLTMQTAAGQLVGTLAYMSPEQVRGSVRAIDARADVYALGVVAYELLGGRLPLDLGTASLAEAARIVVETEPPRLGRMAPACRGDVEWIVARALEKDPERRYQSADALMKDIERHLADEPIEARRHSAIDMLTRLARRHRAVVAGIVSTLLAILIGAGLALHYAIKNAQLAKLEAAARHDADESAREAMRLATVAEKRADDVQVVSDFISTHLGTIDPRELGLHIRDAMREEVRRGLVESGLEGDVLQLELAALDSALDHARTTTVATKTLDRAFFDPMRAEIDRRFADRPELHLKLLLAHGSLLGGQSRMEAAVETLRLAVEIADTLPDETLDTLDARLMLGAQLSMIHRFDEAEPLIEQAVERAEGVLPPMHRRLTHALGDLARAAEARGDLARAEELFREQLARRNMSPDGTLVERTDAVVTINNLGVLLQRTGRAEEAYALAEQAAPLIRPEAPGEAYLEITWRAVRAASLTSLMKLEEGAEEWERAIARARVEYGDQHVHTVGLYRGYAVALLHLGRSAPAEAPLRAILEFNEQEFGPTHLNTARARLNLAYTLYTLKKMDEAEDLAEAALGQFEAVVGNEHERTVYAANLLMEIYRERAAADPGAGYLAKKAALEARFAR